VTETSPQGDPASNPSPQPAPNPAPKTTDDQLGDAGLKALNAERDLTLIHT